MEARTNVGSLFFVAAEYARSRSFISAKLLRLTETRGTRAWPAFRPCLPEGTDLSGLLDVQRLARIRRTSGSNSADSCHASRPRWPSRRRRSVGRGWASVTFIESGRSLQRAVCVPAFAKRPTQRASPAETAAGVPRWSFAFPPPISRVAPLGAPAEDRPQA